MSKDVVKASIEHLKLANQLLWRWVFLELNEFQSKSLVCEAWGGFLERFSGIELEITVADNHHVEYAVALKESLDVPHLLEGFLLPLTWVSRVLFAELSLGGVDGHVGINELVYAW